MAITIMLIIIRMIIIILMMVLMIIIMIIIVINNNNEQNMTAAGVSTSSKLRRLTIRCFPWGRGGISSSTKMCCSLPRDVLPHTQAFVPKV